LSETLQQFYYIVENSNCKSLTMRSYVCIWYYQITNERLKVLCGVYHLHLRFLLVIVSELKDGEFMMYSPKLVRQKEFKLRKLQVCKAVNVKSKDTGLGRKVDHILSILTTPDF